MKIIESPKVESSSSRARRVVNGLALEAGDVVVVSKLDRLGRSAAIRRALVCVFNRIGKN